MTGAAAETIRIYLGQTVYKKVFLLKALVKNHK